MRTIVISAVNIRKGGTLTILRSCLKYLSMSYKEQGYRVVALVHKREVADYPGIEYIEFPNTIKSWFSRLWCEYVTMKRVSEQLAPVTLWLSLHDTTPNVKSEIQAVYCQTSFPFLKSKWQDLLFDYKIVLFSLLTRFAYKINVKRNKYLIVQAGWLRDGLSKMLSVNKEKIIVYPPAFDENVFACSQENGVKEKQFLYAATPDCHKNFELLCEAAELLEQEIGEGKFSVTLTISGSENRYAKWLYKRWGHVKSVDFRGFMDRNTLFEWYGKVDCLVFPSRVETWGLPITEFSATRKPMLLSDLPYAYETASGCENVVFFNSQDVYDLKEKMKQFVLGDLSGFRAVSKKGLEQPVANNWEELFEILLSKV